MDKNIEHYVFHKKNFLNNKQCKDYVKELNVHAWTKHDWHNSHSGTFSKPSGDNEPEYIESKDFSDKVATINEAIIKKLHVTILEYIQSLKFNWYEGWNGYSGLKFIRYCPNQTMKNHCDHIHSLFDGERKGVPVLSIIGVLNDDYEGGELIMFEDKKINTKAGDLLIFPSNFLYPHQIAPVTKRARYSYVSWVW
jgi:predicted 2-oxoglutarate/Fe(II)-dependent dioxygenase YbiX